MPNAGKERAMKKQKKAASSKRRSGGVKDLAPKAAQRVKGGDVAAIRSKVDKTTDSIISKLP